MKLNRYDQVRIYAIPTILLAYSIALCTGMSISGAIKEWYGYFVTVIWFFAFIALQFYIAWKSVSKFEEKPWSWTFLNVPLFAFILMIIGPYMYSLQHTHKRESPKAQIKLDVLNFVLLQVIMLVIFVADLLYPLPKRDLKLTYASVSMNILNSFDIIEISKELTYIQFYNTGTHVWFYIAVVVSTILLAFPIGLDEEDEDDPKWGRIIKSFLSLIFTDLSFLVLRSIVMSKEGILEMEFVFKNAVSTLYTIILLFYNLK